MSTLLCSVTKFLTPYFNYEYGYGKSKKCYLIILTLTSCVTQGEYEKNLRSWVGRTESELIERLGTPSRNYTTEDGKKLLSFDWSRIVVHKFGSNTRWCNETFTIDVKTKKITNWQYDGNACYDF